MKGKYTMIISIGFAALILTAIMFTQFKTVEQTDITAIETMRETELRDELATWKTKYEEVETKLEERKQKIEEYKQELDNNENAMQLLQSEVVEAEEYLGFTELQGEGIVVTLKDNEDANIEYWDLLFLVNELVSAGAEAISINDQRLVTTTSISCGGNIIDINGEKVGAPFVIKAIGLPEQLAGLSRPGGYLEILKNASVGAELKKSNNITIPKYAGVINYQYMKVVK